MEYMRASIDLGMNKSRNAEKNTQLISKENSIAELLPEAKESKLEQFKTISSSGPRINFKYV
jgi:hypothetical protein